MGSTTGRLWLPCPRRLAKLDSLRELHIQGDAITDAAVGRLARLGGLEILYLHHAKRLTDAGLPKLAGLGNLRNLGLAGATGISDEGLATLGGLEGLRWLDVQGCPGLTDAGVAMLEQRLPRCEIRGPAGRLGPNVPAVVPPR